MLVEVEKLVEEMMERSKGWKNVQGKGISIGLCFHRPRGDQRGAMVGLIG